MINKMKRHKMMLFSGDRAECNTRTKSNKMGAFVTVVILIRVELRSKT